MTIAAAVALDGAIAPAPLGSPLDRRRLLDLRRAHDASIIGAGTLRAEDPRLVCPGRRRLRCLLSGSGRFPVAGKSFFSQGDHPVVFTTGNGAAAARGAVGGLADVVAVEDVWHDIIDELTARGVRSLLVEGGGGVYASAVAAGVVGGMEITLVPRLMGSDGAPRLFQWGPEGLAAPQEWRLVACEPQPSGELFLRFERLEGAV